VSGKTGCDISKFLQRSAEAQRRAVDAALKATDEFGYVKVLGDAQSLTPVDTGFLQSSATDEPAELRGTKVTKRIGFNAEYAVFVHEDLNAHHDVGQAKYLEASVRNNASKFAPFVAERVKEALG
jgi:hypothetical protein